jgi:hypothetical protein
MNVLSVVYQSNAKRVAEKLAKILQEMAKTKLDIEVQAEFGVSPNPEYGLSFTLRTTEYNQKALSFREEAVVLLRNETFIRPVAVGILPMILVTNK